jgi:outer membrane protein
MKKIFLILGALMVSLFASAQLAWTLEQCVDSALLNNRNIKQRELARKSNEIAYQQARNNLMPNLSASANQGWSFGRSQIVDGTYQNINSSNTTFSLSSGITLFDGLRMKYDIDARMADLKVAEANLEKINEDIVLSVSTAYLQVILNKELVTNAEEQVKLTETKIIQQNALVESGKKAEGEMYELFAQQSNEELILIQSQNNLKLSLLDLAQIIELSNFEDFDIVVPQDLITNELAFLSPDQIYQSALNHRPEIKVAEYQLEGSKRNVQIAKSSYFPTLSFGANVGGGYYNSVETPLSTNLGLSLSVPIFNKFATRSQVRTAQINVESTKIAVENSKKELQKRVQQAYFNAVAAKAKWDASQKSEVASKEAYRFVNQKYEGGRASTFELYQSKNNMAKALSEVSQSKFEYIFRLKILELLN